MHFVSSDHVRTQLQVTTDEALFFEQRGVLQPVTKNGRVFYSARDVYRLRGILYFTRQQGLSFEKARERVDAPLAAR